MNKSVAFRLSKLAIVLGVVGVSTSSHAVYNLYKKDGLTLDINGQVDIQATKKEYAHTILNDADKTDFYVSNARVYKTGVETSYVKEKNDSKPRLGQSHGVSYVEFRGAQILPQDWRVTGNIGLGYSDARDMYLNNASLSFDKKNLGAITLGRQYLHTNYVGRTGTDTPLDTFSQSALRLDYYGIKGLHASAYYSLADVNDVRKQSNSGIEYGFGASASYKTALANNHSLRVAAGYSENKANPAFLGTWTENSLNKYPEKTRGAAVSAEYQAGKFLVAADAGRKEEMMSKDVKTPLESKTSNYAGVKLAFDINPVTQISAGYGVKKTDTKLKAGAVALSADSGALNTQGSEYSYVDGDETQLFDKANTQEAYVQADYRIRPNVRLYTRYDAKKTTYQVADKDFGEIKDNNIRAGVVFSF